MACDGALHVGEEEPELALGANLDLRSWDTLLGDHLANQCVPGFAALGGLLAVLLTAIAIALFAGPVGELAALYGGGYRLHGLGFSGASLLIAAGGLLGWLGAELSVGLSLRQSAGE